MAMLNPRYAAVLFLPCVWLHRLHKASIEGV